METPSEATTIPPYALAYGYALGIIHATPANSIYGVITEVDAERFAVAYSSVYPKFRPHVQTAFETWRATGDVI